MNGKQRLDRVDNVIRKAAMALGATDEWTDQETMIADFEQRFSALRAERAKLEAALEYARALLRWITDGSNPKSKPSPALAQPAESGATESTMKVTNLIGKLEPGMKISAPGQYYDGWTISDAGANP